MAFADPKGNLPVFNGQKLPLSAITKELLVIKQASEYMEYLFMKSVLTSKYKASLLHGSNPILPQRQKDLRNSLKNEGAIGKPYYDQSRFYGRSSKRYYPRSKRGRSGYRSQGSQDSVQSGKPK